MTTYALTANTRRTLGTPNIVTQVFDATERALDQNDIAELIPVPANTLVMALVAEVLVEEGAARNYAIGDGGDDDGYITTTSANTAGATAMTLALTEGTPNTLTGYTAGRFYDTADTIDLKAVTAGGLTATKIRVTAMMVTFP